MTAVEPIIEELFGGSTADTETAIAPWTAGSASQQAPADGNYNNTVAVLHWAFPGFALPTTYNQYTVSKLAAEMIALLSTEAVRLYGGLVQTAALADANAQAVINLSGAIGGLTGQVAAGPSAQALASELAGLQAQINVVAANAFNNLWALYNNQVVPLVNATAGALNAQIGALGYEVNVLGINQQSLASKQDLANQFNNQVVPLINATAGTLSYYQNVQSVQINTLESQVANKVDVADLTATSNTLQSKIANGVSTAERYATDAVAQLQTQLQPQLDKLNTDVETCLDPLCDTVTPNANQLGRLGSLLKAFEGAGIAALLAALVAEAIHDPQDSADAIVAATGWAPSLADELVQAVF